MEIGAGEAREYQVAAQAGDYVRIRIKQFQLDVTARLTGPSGQVILEADGVGGRKKPELLPWIAAEGGIHRLTLTAKEDGAAGSCKVVLEELRPSAAADAQRVAAELATSEADHWLAREDADSKREALARYEEALALWQVAGDRTNEVHVLNRIATIHRGLGNKGIDLFESALVLARESGSRRGEAETLNNLGVARYELGQMPEALQAFQESLRLWEELVDAWWIATTSIGLGLVQMAQGQMDAALVSLTRALELRQADGDPDDVPLILGVLGSIYRERGEGDKALEVYQRALLASRAADDRRGQANVLQEMAIIHYRRGELQRALEMFTGALELHEALGNRQQQGWELFYLGKTTLYLGDLGRALEFYERSLPIHRETGDTTWEAYALGDVGWIYHRRGEPREAFESYSRAYEISLTANNRRGQAMALQGMGLSQVSLDNPQEGARLLKQAVELYQGTGDILGTIHSALDLGRACLALSDTHQAAEHFYRALAMSREHKTLITEAVALSAVAKLERDRGNLLEASASIEEALRIVESIRPKVAAQRQRVSFFASRRDYYDFQVDLQMRLHERGSAGGHLEAALAASERARARALLDLLAEGRIDLQRGISVELKRREEEIENRISLLQGDLLDDLSRGGSRAARIEAELGRAEQEREQLEWQIQREHPHYAAFRNPALLPPDRIQGMLDERTALLEYAVGQESSFLFVVTRDRLEGFRLASAGEIAGLVETVRKSLEEPGSLQRRRYAEAAHRLYEILLAPAEAMLVDKPHLIFSPDGPLLQLSFEALLTAPAPPGRGYAGLPYLIREKSVAYVPSASVLLELGMPAEGAVLASRGAGLFLGFADPAHEQAPVFQGPAAVSPLARTLQDAGLPSPQRLPNARNELLEISKLFPPGQAQRFLDGDASEENVKENPVLREARWIHFAVHGFVDESRPELSGLVLRLDGDPKENGLLQVYEIFNLELSADLVVLSACDTGRGSNIRGEGIVGISRALLYAGAASVVVSLWQVADTSTADLMVHFYRHLVASGDKAEALRLSKLEMIQGGQYDHPYYWAPFILIGHPGAGNVPAPGAPMKRAEPKPFRTSYGSRIF
ncbi:MAG TPA: CHAT domain-containing protein [Thermoanaerobaculia bacterium]|nr:CHAT domain-containing protein [Thermoanaerobaculia bacterium]